MQQRICALSSKILSSHLRPRLAFAPVAAARVEFWRRSFECRCRCSSCSGTRDREAISSWISLFALCGAHIQAICNARVVPSYRVTRRFRGLASGDQSPSAANVSRVDTYTADRLRTSCVAPFCAPEVRRFWPNSADGCEIKSRLVPSVPNG